MIVIDQFQCMINVTYLLFLSREFAFIKIYKPSLSLRLIMCLMDDTDLTVFVGVF